MKNSKGISGVVAMVIMIALVMAAIVIVWVVVNNLIRGETGGAEACFAIFDKVNINDRYTCYEDNTAPENDYLRFSISIGDLDVNEVLVAVSGEGSTVSFKITEEGGPIDHITNYPVNIPGQDISLPEKNAGKTYLFDLTGGFAGRAPDLVEIAPIIGRSQCGASDSIDEIESCSLIP
jgi:hypothetical protein